MLLEENTAKAKSFVTLDLALIFLVITLMAKG
jgi:hypothetical protein